MSSKLNLQQKRILKLFWVHFLNHHIINKPLSNVYYNTCIHKFGRTIYTNSLTKLNFKHVTFMYNLILCLFQNCSKLL